MRSPTTHILVAACLALTVAASSVTAQRAPISHEQVGPIQLERPGDAPADARTLPRNNPSARSPRAIVQRGSFTSIQVNVDEFGQNITGDAANEPSIAVRATDPTNIVIGWRQFDTTSSNFRQAGDAYSDDAGQTWTFPGVLDPGQFRSDPVLDTDVDGNLYYYSLSTLESCELFISDDGGVTWSDDIPAFGGDKAWMVVDRSGGIGTGHVYAKWQTFFGCCEDRTFTRSIDGGLSFQQPITVPLGPTFGTLNVGPDGEVYAAGIEGVDFQNYDVTVIARSSNAQNPAQTPVFELATEVDLGGSVELGEAPNPAGLMGQVSVVTDHSDGPTRGNVYMLASTNPPGADPLDVYFNRSTDGGQTWTDPIRVNDDAPDSDSWQWFGTIAVAPNGRIDVIWNDTRNSGQARLNELYYSYSLDAGDTWSTNQPVSPQFDSHLGWPDQNKLGDYYDMRSDNAGADLAWAATFNGEQDVYYLRIPVPCAGDVDGNNVVNFADLLAVLSAWGPCSGCPEDLNGDNSVGFDDLLIVLSGWGSCD